MLKLPVSRLLANLEHDLEPPGSNTFYMSSHSRSVFFALFNLALLGWVQNASSQVPHRFALESIQGRILEKGRFQDLRGGNWVGKQIVEAGESAIPVLISQLTESVRTKEPIEDYWSYTTSGDIAFMFLNDLFTDKDWKSFTLPGVPNWQSIMSGCNLTAETCWRNYVRKSGIRSVQHSWQTAWETNRDRIIWDPNSRCFRLRK